MAPAMTLHQQVRLVVLDVVVVDRKGVPITGLKASQFQLKEDGTPQKIASFEEHQRGSTKAATSPVAANGTITATNEPLNRPAVWNVLLIDTYEENLATTLMQ